MPVKIIKLKADSFTYAGTTTKITTAKNVIGGGDLFVINKRGDYKDIIEEVYSKDEIDNIKKKVTSDLIKKIENIIQDHFLSLKENIINDPKLSKKVAEHILNDNTFLEKLKNNS
ncbi:hypothetical protein [Tenacibaculum jejuense]|uniref:Uncharacterized protein n=1 Tax=Tenacibaculum jejuense TaxID=584609 RepID=A0A238UBR4_9FLAO|nr:hypothetical protein [Tenacibaculum jejuense]SNR16657.1 protein of unknown function [Tenacibaculum jejuense]